MRQFRKDPCRVHEIMSIKPPHAPLAAATASESPDDDVPSEQSQAAATGAGVDALIDWLSPAADEP
jgi:hypothetical protein